MKTFRKDLSALFPGLQSSLWSAVSIYAVIAILRRESKSVSVWGRGSLGVQVAGGGGGLWVNQGR